MAKPKTTEMEQKYAALDIVELKVQGDSQEVEGYASVFNNVDSYKDIVMPGAFAKSIKRRKPAMLWQHNPNHVVGKWTDVEEQDKGLYIKGKLVDTTMGMDVYKLAKAGAITGLSIGYSPTTYEIDKDKGVRRLTEIELYEVSFVTFPANERAQLTRVKNVDGSMMTEREFEEFLRDAGQLSHRDAKVIVSQGYKALMNQRDVGTDAQERMTKLLNQFKL